MRKACHEFAERKGWTIVREEQETGVSGFKVSAADRDEYVSVRQLQKKDSYELIFIEVFNF